MVSVELEMICVSVLSERFKDGHGHRGWARMTEEVSNMLRKQEILRPARRRLKVIQTAILQEA